MAKAVDTIRRYSVDKTFTKEVWEKYWDRITIGIFQEAFMKISDGCDMYLVEDNDKELINIDDQKILSGIFDAEKPVCILYIPEKNKTVHMLNKKLCTEWTSLPGSTVLHCVYQIEVVLTEEEKKGIKK